MANILVTGGHGFLGSALCKKLEERGYQYEAPVSAAYDFRSFSDTNKMYEDWRPETIIHLAARVGGIGANMANPGSFTYDNLMMGANIIEAGRRHGLKKIIIAGTVCAYPCHCKVPFKEEDLWCGYPEPTNAGYALAKKMLLVLLDGYRKQYGLNGVFLLPTNLFGPRDSFDLENSHVIPAMIRKFHEAKINDQDEVVLWGDGSPTREFLYVDDCAEAFIRAMERYDSPGPLNLGTGKEVAMKDLAEEVRAVTGYPGKTVWDVSRPNGQPRRCLDTTKAFAALDWRATTGLREGLLRTYSWYVQSLSHE